MNGFRFSEWKPQNTQGSKFDQLLDILQQLLLIFAGDVGQSLSYLNELDRRYQLTDDSYGMANFIGDLKAKGYLQENPSDGQL